METKKHINTYEPPVLKIKHSLDRKDRLDRRHSLAFEPLYEPSGVSQDLHVSFGV